MLLSPSPRPLTLLHMHSHHSHSGAYCCHAAPHTSPSSMLAQARSRGFTHYNLTEHIPRAHKDALYPEERTAGVTPASLLDTFEDYLVEARRCSDTFASADDGQGTLQVLVGVELENLDGRTEACLQFNESILRDAKTGAWKVDYVVGSVHHVYGIPIDFDKETYEQALQQMLDETNDAGTTASLQVSTSRTRAHLCLMLAYLQAQYNLLQHFQPEVIGHFDLCRLFDRETPMTATSSTMSKTPLELHSLLNEVDASVRRNVAYATQYGALFELNSASVRKGWPTPYPGEDVLDIILAHNGRLCLSDDAHSHEQIGLNYHLTEKYLLHKNVDAVWLLRRPKADHDDSEKPFRRGTIAERIPLSQLDDFWVTPTL